MGRAGAPIAFLCRAPDHLQKNVAFVGHLTVHEKQWAYCPSNVRTDGHDWKATGGVTMGELEIVIRGMRERAGVNGNGHARKEDR